MGYRRQYLGIYNNHKFLCNDDPAKAKELSKEWFTIFNDNKTYEKLHVNDLYNHYNNAPEGFRYFDASWFKSECGGEEFGFNEKQSNCNGDEIGFLLNVNKVFDNFLLENDLVVDPVDGGFKPVDYAKSTEGIIVRTADVLNWYTKNVDIKKMLGDSFDDFNKNTLDIYDKNTGFILPGIMNRLFSLTVDKLKNTYTKDELEKMELEIAVIDYFFQDLVKKNTQSVIDETKAKIIKSSLVDNKYENWKLDVFWCFLSELLYYVSESDFILFREG